MALSFVRNRFPLEGESLPPMQTWLQPLDSTWVWWGGSTPRICEGSHEGTMTTSVPALLLGWQDSERRSLERKKKHAFTSCLLFLGNPKLKSSLAPTVSRSTSAWGDPGWCSSRAPRRCGNHGETGGGVWVLFFWKTNTCVSGGPGVS